MYRTAREHQLWDWNNVVHFGAAALKCVQWLPSTALQYHSATDSQTDRLLCVCRWVHECAAGKDGVVKARGGEYVLRYRSAKRELQLVKVS